MNNFNTGDLVKTNNYYNTQPFSGNPIKKGVILEMQHNDAFDVAIVRNERGHVHEIPTKFLIKVK